MKYLAQREMSGMILATDGKLLPAWEEDNNIARWGSKLSCHLAIEEWLKRHDDRDTDDCFVVRKIAEDAKPIVICNDDIAGLLADVVKWHDCYCGLIEQWLEKSIGFDASKARRPECRMTLADVSWAGQYSPREHVCDYSMAYAMVVGMADGGVNCGHIGLGFYSTIAHECCHAYQDAFTGVGTGHGGDFYAMMKHACFIPIRQHKHSYDGGIAIQVARSLVPFWKRQMADGIVATLPCGVDTTFVKRAESID